jgi:hypothetical protein
VFQFFFDKNERVECGDSNMFQDDGDGLDGGFYTDGDSSDGGDFQTEAHFSHFSRLSNPKKKISVEKMSEGEIGNEKGLLDEELRLLKLIGSLEGDEGSKRGGLDDIDDDSVAAQNDQNDQKGRETSLHDENIGGDRDTIDNDYEIDMEIADINLELKKIEEEISRIKFGVKKNVPFSEGKLLKQCNKNSFFLVLHGYHSHSTLPLNTTYPDSYFITQQVPIPQIRFTAFTIHKDELPNISETKQFLFLSYLFNLLSLEKEHSVIRLEDNLNNILRMYDCNVGVGKFSQGKGGIRKDKHAEREENLEKSLIDDHKLTSHVLIKMLLNGLEPSFQEINRGVRIGDWGMESNGKKCRKKSNLWKNKIIQKSTDGLQATLHDLQNCLPIRQTPSNKANILHKNMYHYDINENRTKLKKNKICLKSEFDTIILISHLIKLKTNVLRKQLLRSLFDVNMLPRSIHDIPTVFSELISEGALPRDLLRFIGLEKLANFEEENNDENEEQYLTILEKNMNKNQINDKKNENLFSDLKFQNSAHLNQTNFEQNLKKNLEELFKFDVTSALNTDNSDDSEVDFDDIDLNECLREESLLLETGNEPTMNNG